MRSRGTESCPLLPPKDQAIDWLSDDQILKHTGLLHLGASLMAQMVKNLLAMQKMWIQSLGQEDPLEKGLSPLFSMLAWRIPRTEDPGRLQSMGSWRVGHEGVTNIFTPPVTWAPCWTYFGYPRALHTSPSPPHGDSNNSTDTRSLKSPNYTLEIWQ